ncbi:MAG: PDZ domain-containing protein [Pirellulales bacterium]
MSFSRILSGGLLLAGACVALSSRADDTVAAPRDLTTVTGQVVGAEGAAGVPKQITIRVVGDAATVVADAGAGGDGAAKKRFPYIGVATSPVSAPVRAQTGLSEDVGLAIDAVTPGSPATAAGLMPFDVLTKYDDQILCAAVQLSALVKRTGTGNSATLTVLRGGKEMTVPVKIGEREADVTMQVIAPGMPGMGFGQAGMGFGQGGVAIANLVPGQGLDQAALERLTEWAKSGGVWQGQVQGVVPLPGGPPGIMPPPVPPVPVPGGNQRWLFINPNGPPAGSGVALGTPGAVQSQSQSISVFSSAEGRVELRTVNGKKTVSVFDAAGKEQYAGPYDTDADRAAVPEALRDRVEKAAAASDGVRVDPAQATGKQAKKISL